MTDIVVMETSNGTIEIELNRGRAPVTVKNFVQYVNDGFFNGLCFHRVIKGFMIQGGGFTPLGMHKETRVPIQIESRNGLKNTRGSIAMARTNNPASATSQFFINTVDNMDVVDEIEGAPTVTTMTPNGPMQDWPKAEICINKVSMKEA